MTHATRDDAFKALSNLYSKAMIAVALLKNVEPELSKALEITGTNAMEKASTTDDRTMDAQLKDASRETYAVIIGWLGK
jgi:hypothetical protein